MTLSILYRGDLSSCNYDCPYCPFAKQKDSRATLATDAQQVARFVEYIRQHPQIQFKVFFTPWGEGLIRMYYQQAMVELSHCNNVEKVAIQTNLSCRLGWLKKANNKKIALWSTYHPGQVSREAFLDKCSQLDGMGVSYSVGIVGFKETISEIETMRTLLPAEKYLWVNALKKQADYYNEEERGRLIAIDPYVTYNMVHHESKGKACRTGDRVISVDGTGNIYRCHFIKEKLGNLYQHDLNTLLQPRLCTNATCGCHIGYVHMNDLGLYDVYQGRELERIISKLANVQM
jgi:sulfatase maturation enzyme AslB (radical SAM superfamily)